MTNEFIQAMEDMCTNAELVRQEENKENKADKLNEIMKDLCDWMADTKFIVREISFYSFGSKVIAHLSIGKNVDGKIIAIDREFYLEECFNSQAWEDYNVNNESER